MSERDDVLLRLIEQGEAWARYEGMVSLAAEGFCPQCGHELGPGRGHVYDGPGVGAWCVRCRRAWQVVVQVWPDARSVDLDEYNAAGVCAASHGWLDHR